jgi:hypothetical protein
MVVVKIRSDDSFGSLLNSEWPQILEPIAVEKTSFGDFVAAHSLEHVCARIDVAGAEEAFFDGAKSALDKLDYLIIGISGSAIERRLPSRVIREGNFHAYYINDYKLEHSMFGECKYVEPFHNWLFCVENPVNLRAKLTRTKFHVVDMISTLPVMPPANGRS